MKSASIQGGQYAPLTNVGTPAATLEQLHVMNDEEFGYKLQEWHGGGSDPLYAVGSSLGAGHLEVFKDKMIVQRALKSLENIYHSPESTYGDRIETMAMADELKFRWERYMESHVDNQPEVTAWIRNNCKFAMKKTASILDLLTKQERAQIIGDPSTALSILEQKYMQRMKMGGEFGQQLTATDVAGDLAEADKALFPTSPPGTLNNPKTVRELLQIVGQNQRAEPKPLQPQKQVVQDPFEAFRQQQLNRK